MMINKVSSNTSLEIPRCLATNTQDQREMTRFSQHSQQQKYFSLSSFIEKPPEGYKGELLVGLGSVIFGEFPITRPIKTDPGLPDCGTSTCPPPAMKPGEENFKKRKADNNTFQPSKAKRCHEEEKFASNKLDANKLDIQNNNSDNSYNNIDGIIERKMKEISGVSSMDNQKGSEVEKLDYIHVRARRGQATNSHSLAERVRREKISERMKYLQELVPGCNKITGKAGMLDEIINYLQSLQRQVEFLSMKLAAVNPSLDFNIEDLFVKEAYPTCSSNIPAMGVSTEMANLEYLNYNSGDLGLSEAEMSIQQSTTDPIMVPGAFLDSSCLTSCLPWEQSDLQNIYNMEFQQAGQPFPSQTYNDLARPF